MNIAVDIDGVILNLISRVCEIFNELFNTNYTENDVRQWEFFKDWRVSEEIIFDVFYEAYEDSMILPLIDEDAPQILKQLNVRNRIDLVTARNVQYEVKLLEKLDSLEIIKGIHYENLIHVESKPFDAKIFLDYDIFIDDNPNLVNSIERFPNKKILLYDQPWNRNHEDREKVVRVYNWKQIKSIILLNNI